MASSITGWLEKLARHGALVLIGDPVRAYLARERLEWLAEYRIPITRALEHCEIKKSQVWKFKDEGAR
jgi:predicted nicotinamide N-methyase